MLKLQRRNQTIATIYDDNAVIREQMMSARELSVKFSLPEYVEIKQGDYIDAEGVRFFVFERVSCEKLNNGTFSYNFVLYGQEKRLENVLFLFLDEDARQKTIYNALADFEIVASLEEYLSIIIRNMNRDSDSAWRIEIAPTADKTEVKRLAFAGVSCLYALQRIAEEYDVEWVFDGGVIKVEKKIEHQTGITFEYPVNLLSSVVANTQKAETDCNRLFVYGSDKNIPSGYGSARLMMPNGRQYIQSAEAYTFAREAVKTFDDIYPHRDGVVTAVRKRNTNETDENGNELFVWLVTDLNLGFNLREQMNGNTPKIAFNSGNLVGYTFEVESYDFSTQSFELRSQRDVLGNSVPNDIMRPQNGDKYVLLDIDLPEKYIRDAEKRLEQEAKRYFEQNCINQLQVEVKPRTSYLLQNDVKFHAGDMVRVKDADFKIDTSIRIIRVERRLFGVGAGYEQSLTLSTFTPRTRLDSMEGSITQAKQTIINNNYKTIQQISNIQNNVNNIGDKQVWHMGG